MSFHVLPPIQTSPVFADCLLATCYVAQPCETGPLSCPVKLFPLCQVSQDVIGNARSSKLPQPIPQTSSDGHMDDTLPACYVVGLPCPRARETHKSSLEHCFKYPDSSRHADVFASILPRSAPKPSPRDFYYTTCRFLRASMRLRRMSCAFRHECPDMSDQRLFPQPRHICKCPGCSCDPWTPRFVLDYFAREALDCAYEYAFRFPRLLCFPQNTGVIRICKISDADSLDVPTLFFPVRFTFADLSIYFVYPV